MEISMFTYSRRMREALTKFRNNENLTNGDWLTLQDAIYLNLLSDDESLDIIDKFPSKVLKNTPDYQFLDTTYLLELQKEKATLLNRIKSFMRRFEIGNIDTDRFRSSRDTTEDWSEIKRHLGKYYKSLNDQKTIPNYYNKKIAKIQLFSLDLQFTTALDQLRKKWNFEIIEPSEYKSTRILPEDIVINEIFDTPFMNNDLYTFHSEIKHYLCLPYKRLNFEDDYGFLIGSLFLGFDIDELDQCDLNTPYMKLFLALMEVRKHNRNIKLKYDTDLKLASAMLTISYLSNELHRIGHENQQPTKNPSLLPIVQWVKESNKLVKFTGIKQTELPNIINFLTPHPLDNLGNYYLHIYVDEFTTFKSVNSMLNLAKGLKAFLYGKNTSPNKVQFYKVRADIFELQNASISWSEITERMLVKYPTFKYHGNPLATLQEMYNETFKHIQSGKK